jgi:hypothetical protein
VFALRLCLLAEDFGRNILFGKTMSEASNSSERLFRVCFWTVEYFGILLVAAFWLLLSTGSAWGDKFHYDYLFDSSVPVMIVVGLSAFLTWRRYRRDSLLHIAVLIGWAVWVALPRL